MSGRLYVARDLKSATHREVVVRVEGIAPKATIEALGQWLASLCIHGAVIDQTKVTKYGSGYTLHVELPLEDIHGQPVLGRYRHRDDTDTDALALATRALQIPIDSRDIARLLNLIDACASPEDRAREAA